MAYRLKFLGRALREIGEAFAWYEEQSTGLGSEFQLAFELQLKRLEQVPLLYPAIIRAYAAHSFHDSRTAFFTPSDMTGFRS